MSHILITGANGFVGRALAQHLLDTSNHAFTLLDQHFDAPGPPGVCHVQGSLTDPAVLDRAFENQPDIVYHLASVPGALAERQYHLGYEVNLQGTLALAHRLAQQNLESARPARLVFASSVAVYGDLGNGDAHEHQTARPALSYGAHKLMAEIALADLSRRGAIDAVSLRLPGIVARPPTETGHGSAFMSLIMRKLAAGEPYACPVPSHGTAWWMSLPCCVANLIHAGEMSTVAAPASRTWQLPVLTLSMADILSALERRYGPHCRELISYQLDERITALFGSMPLLHTPTALAAGFRHDGDADQLIQASLK